jgi:hypothetical protein
MDGFVLRDSSAAESIGVSLGGRRLYQNPRNGIEFIQSVVTNRDEG